MLIYGAGERLPPCPIDFLSLRIDSGDMALARNSASTPGVLKEPPSVGYYVMSFSYAVVEKQSYHSMW